MLRLLAFMTLTFTTLWGSLAAAQDKGQKDKGDPAQKDAKQPPPNKSPIGLLVNDPRAFQGYNLFSPLNSTKTYLIDMAGKVVRTWEGAANVASSAYLLPNGNLLRPCGPGGGGRGGRVQEFTWSGELVWDYQCPPEHGQHHDAIKLPNGNVLILAYDRKTADAAAAAGRKSAGGVTTDRLVEVRPNGKTGGEVVWEWRLWDHLIQDHDKTKANFGDVAAHPELVDVNFTGGGKGGGEWTHINGISYNPELDQIMMSVHTLSEVWIIDHSTTKAEAAAHKGGKQGKGGDLLYRWGNPRSYRAGTNKDQQLFSQHNTTWIPKGLPGEGHLLVFNNGNNRPGGQYSSVDEIVLPVDSEGRYAHKSGVAFGPAKPLWSYSAPKKNELFSSFISGAQRLANGNTLICSGENGILIEVTPKNEVVWKYINPVSGWQPAKSGKGPGGGGWVFRVTRYAPDYAALIGRDLTPGRTLEPLSPKKGGKEGGE